MTDQVICGIFKQRALEAYFTGGSFKVALYKSTASLNENTTAYTTSNEVSGSGYSAGGAAITPTVSLDGATAVVDFADVTWSGLTVTDLRYAMIYNTVTGEPIAIIDLGRARNVSTDFTLQFPAATAALGILRFK